MPLGNTRDSFQNLKNLAQAHNSAGTAGHSDLQLRLEESNQNNFLESVQQQIPNAQSVMSTFDDDESSWWELGHDVAKYESVFYGTKRKRTNRKDCSVCFVAPWFGRHESDSEDDDHNKGDGYDDSLRTCSSGDSHREGGILKRSSLVVQVTPGVDKTKRRTFNPLDFHEHHHDKVFVRFSNPIGTVVTIQPFYTMTQRERSEIWWQQSDFDAFKLELRLLTNSKQLGGCEVWLGDEALGEQQSNKWWHKFGHSRRGLERYLSQEQKEVESSKRLALSVVLNEQKKRYKSKNKEEEIAKVYKEFTAWSRNLALAAAASDADAVRTDFDEASRKTREYYLAKQAILSGGSSIYDQPTPAFMVPSGLKKRSSVKSVPIPSISNVLPSKRTSVAKKAAGFGNSENVGSMMSAIKVATRAGGQE